MKRKILAFMAVLFVWFLAAALANRPFLPGPLNVFPELLHEIISGSLPMHLGISLLRVLSAVVAAAIPATVMGITSGVSTRADGIISPVMYLLFPVPKVALLPVILLFLGLGNLSKVFLVSLIVFFQFYLNIRDETKGISRKYFDSLLTLGGTRRHILIHIIFPALLPRFFSSLRLVLGTAIAVLFLAETFATRTGIGWYIMDSWSRLSYTQMYAGISALSFAGLGLFFFLDIAEYRYTRWIA